MKPTRESKHKKYLMKAQPVFICSLMCAKIIFNERRYKIV